MTTFAEDLTNEYNRDDIKLAELIQKGSDADQDLAERIAYAFVNRDWNYLIRYVDGLVADEVAERQREHDARLLASYDGDVA